MGSRNEEDDGMMGGECDEDKKTVTKSHKGGETTSDGRRQQWVVRVMVREFETVRRVRQGVESKRVVVAGG